MKPKRQAMSISIEQLEKLIKDLKLEQWDLCRQLKLPMKHNPKQKILIGIINKTPECSDTWQIEKL